MNLLYTEPKEEPQVQAQFKIDENLIVNCRSDLVNHMTRLTQNRPMAEDIAHDAIITVIHRIRTTGISNHSCLIPYLKKTAYYMYIGSLRKVCNQVELFDSLDSQQSGSYYPEEEMSKQDTTEIVTGLIDGLHIQRDKEILQRHYLEDESKLDICRSLDISLSQFDRVISRARKRLRQIASENQVSTAIL